MSYCTARGCDHRSVGYGRFCNAHRLRNRRHGDPRQRGVTAKRLEPYKRLIQDHIAKRGGEALWKTIETLHDSLMGRARAILAQVNSGRPFSRLEAKAALLLLRITDDTPARAVIETVAAMAIMARREQRAFTSDRTVFVQTARRVRGLSNATAQTYYSRGRRKRVRTDVSPDVAETMGRMLMEALGNIGIKIANADQAEAERVAKAKLDAYAALSRTEGELDRVA